MSRQYLRSFFAYFPSLAVVCVVLPGPGYFSRVLAEEPVEEIVIVADFRGHRLREIPASIEVIDASMIDAVSIQHFEELTHLVPNLNWAGGASRPRYFQIRGIGERSQYEGAPNPSVGFIVDDLDFSAMGGIATMFDVEQVEVLRGPQGTRYGANALAGLIYIRNRAPSNRFDARFEAMAGNDGAASLGVALGGPLNNVLAWRGVVHKYQSDGFRDNPYLGRDDTNGRAELTTRFKLRYKQNSDWQADLTGMYVELDNGYDAFAIDNGFTTYSDRPGMDSQQTLGGVLSVRGDVSDRFSIVSISGVARSEVEFSFDADWGNDDFWAPVIYDFFSATKRDRQSLNQELRLISSPEGRWFGGRADWLIGASILNSRESNLTTDDGDFEGFAFASRIAREYEATSTAFFGDLDMSVTDTLGLNAGLRWERRDAKYSDSGGDRFNPDETNIGGQLALVYTLSDDTSLYAKVSRGYKAGGFNLGLPAEAGSDLLFYAGEFLWNYEIGINGRWLAGRLGVTGTAFYMRRDDQQVQTSAQLDPNNPATFVFFTDNAGKGRNSGLEVSVDYAASETLSVYASVGLLDTDIEAFGDNRDLEGRDQAHAPNYSFALGGRLDFARDWFARVDVTGKDEFFFSDSHDQKSKSHVLVNARVGLERDNWSVFAWGRNLFDKEYAVRGFFFGNEPARDFADTLYVRRGDPRHFGVSFQYAYGR